MAAVRLSPRPTSRLARRSPASRPRACGRVGGVGWEGTSQCGVSCTPTSPKPTINGAERLMPAQEEYTCSGQGQEGAGWPRQRRQQSTRSRRPPLARPRPGRALAHGLRAAHPSPPLPLTSCDIGTMASRAPRSPAEASAPSHSRLWAGMQPYSYPSSFKRCRHQLRWRLSSSATLHSREECGLRAGECKGLGRLINRAIGQPAWRAGGAQSSTSSKARRTGCRAAGSRVQNRAATGRQATSGAGAGPPHRAKSA